MAAGAAAATSAALLGDTRQDQLVAETLLDIMVAAQAKRAAHRVSRLVYVASGSPSGAVQESVHAKLVHRQLAAEGQGSVMGLLLVLPGCVVHLLEGRSSTLRAILQGLALKTEARVRRAGL
jgi:hypothetical protein